MVVKNAMKIEFYVSTDKEPKHKQTRKKSISCHVTFRSFQSIEMHSVSVGFVFFQIPFLPAIHQLPCFRIVYTYSKFRKISIVRIDIEHNKVSGEI